MIHKLVATGVSVHPKSEIPIVCIAEMAHSDSSSTVCHSKPRGKLKLNRPSSVLDMPQYENANRALGLNWLIIGGAFYVSLSRLFIRVSCAMGTLTRTTLTLSHSQCDRSVEL